MKKYQEILALTASILVIVLVLGAFTALVTPKRHGYGSTWGHYLAEEPDSIDVLFVGSSLTYCNVIPALFWEKTGLTAYDVTGPALTVPGEYYFLREALKTQSPSVVFIEITAALYQRYTGHTDTMLGYIPWGENRLLAVLNEAEPEKIGGLLFPMLTKAMPSLEFILTSTVPFNLLKAVVISAITYFVYKPLSPVLHAKR